MRVLASRRTLRWLLIACLLAGACSSPAPPAQSSSSQASTSEAKAPLEPRAAPNAAQRFTPPDARGFGRAGELIFLEEIVGEAQPSDALPMIVLIHGRGDHPQRGWLPLALPVPVRVIMPQAPLPHGDGFSWSRARASEASGPSGDQLAADLTRMVDQIAELMQLLRQHRPTRGTPLVGGFSQGGMLSFALAALHPEAASLAIPISGLLPEGLWPKQKPSGRLPKIRALHGTADDVVPIGPARAAIAHLAKIGYDATLAEQPAVPHTISPEMVALISGYLLRDGL
jgi:phospholipase/carboxylesterase